MENKRPLILLLLLLLTWPVATALGKSAAVLLREGLYAEEMEGDLDAAIKIYQQVIDDSQAQRKQVAQGLYRQGMCLLKKKDEARAQTVFHTLVSGYSDQTEIVEKVKPVLEELGNADPASLMPLETLMYVEIGSPGRQVETILNMLKGTPLENPLAAIAEKQPQGRSTGSNNPAAMIRNVLNPAVMTEFKKIRGIGVGVTGIAQEAPVTFVLFPGKSETLRGILQMVLGFVGTPAESIEGMQTVAIADGGYVAYDNAVVIAVSPSADAAERLRWSVRQYKGVANEPALSSHNKSFTKISKQLRQQSALTLWLNVNDAYQKLQTIVPADALPKQLHSANAMIDLKHVDDLITSLSLRETGVALESIINFEDGYQSMAYHMIRTPHLNKDALKAVPSEAIALISFALGQPDTPQAQALGQHIKNITGMDLGPTLFANVDQVTLFTLPLGKVGEPQAGQLPTALNSLGLAITSANPGQIRQMLTTLLESAHLLPEGTQASDPVGGKYELALVTGQKLFCQISEASQTTVVSLNPSLVEASVAGLGGGTSAMSQGRFGDALNTLSPATSKLAAVNVAGALRFAAENMDLPSEEGATKVAEALAQLADMSEKTTVRLQTSEEQNSFGIRLSISDLPPADQVFGPVMQIVQTIEDMEAQQAAWETEAPIPASIASTKTAPAIDGKVDDCWAAAQEYPLKNSYYGAPSSASDLSASFKTLADENNLYVLVVVSDDDLRNDSDEFWLDDGVEVFIDADNSRAREYDDDDYQYFFSYDATSPTMGESHHGKTGGVEYAFAKTETGYRVEITFPWATLGTRPTPGTAIGLDVQVNDDDDGGERDSKMAWHAHQDDAWQNPSAFGAAQPLGLVGWWKLDEAAGNEATDASGNGRTGKLIGGPTWQPTGGKVGGALELDGQDDYVDTGYNTNSPTWTIGAWVKSPAAPTSGSPGGPIHREKNYQINWNHTEDPFRGAAGVCVDGRWHAAGFGELEGNTWYHLVASYDGENLKAYKNGVLVTDNPDPSGDPLTEAETLKFGKHAMFAGAFGGTIDEVRLYNYALNAAEIAAWAGE